MTPEEFGEWPIGPTQADQIEDCIMLFADEQAMTMQKPVRIMQHLHAEGCTFIDMEEICPKESRGFE